MESDDVISGELSEGGEYVRYNLYGIMLEVTSKYVPPLRPIGRGAYGLVWLVQLLPFSLSCKFFILSAYSLMIITLLKLLVPLVHQRLSCYLILYVYFF